MQVHVVPSIAVQALTAFDALELVAGVQRNLTRRRVHRRVSDLEPMKVKVAEGPRAQGTQGARRDTVFHYALHRPTFARDADWALLRASGNDSCMNARRAHGIAAKSVGCARQA
jgi:hypothetical protein